MTNFALIKPVLIIEFIYYFFYDNSHDIDLTGLIL